MFGLSFGEIVIIAIVALLLLGPDKLPDAAKTLGKGLREIRKATDELKDQVEKEINLSELMADKPTAPKPSLVPPVAAAARAIPGPSGPPPAATAENVPGLELALAEPITVAEETSAPAAAAAAPSTAAETTSSSPPPPAAPSTPNDAQGS